MDVQGFMKGARGGDTGGMVAVSAGGSAEGGFVSVAEATGLPIAVDVGCHALLTWRAPTGDAGILK